MPTLVLLRHGQSVWNLQNRYTGWTDVDLTEQGSAEARRAGERLLNAGLHFDLAYTSVLKRAIRTLWECLEAMDQMWVPIVTDWRLNERHYGALTGLDKAQTKAKYGEEQVKQWRRSYLIRPPALDPKDPRNLASDIKYKHLAPGQVPLTESLADTYERVRPWWEDNAAPELLKGRTVLVSASGNSLRALVKHLEGMSDKAVEELEIPNAVPLVYDLDSSLVPKAHRYLQN